jgi:galactose mutarotase-like enzyme
MNVSVGKTSWHGLEAWALENDTIRTVIVPDLGAKLVSLLDKRTQLEWLVGPDNRPFKKVPYGSTFIDQDMSGWDEMFPTIVACSYPAPGESFGTSLPDHGEVWSLSWVLESSPSGTLSLSVEGKALPYQLTRTLAYSDIATLQMHYELKNMGLERMPYMWAAHPQFECGEDAEILLPPQVTEVCNTIPAEWGWGLPETCFDWPDAVSSDGQRVRINHTGPASLKQARKFFLLPETRVKWAGLIRRPAGDWLRLDWNPDKVPYLGIWVDEGALSNTTVVALEPITGFYDSLAVAWKKNEVTVLEPGATQAWTLSVKIGTGEQPFPCDL